VALSTAFDDSPVSPLLAIGSQMASLKVVFWNSNCWNTTNCEKISETAREHDADIICITDARSDDSKARFMTGYLSTIKRITGKTWRGKIESRPSRRSKCSVGGDIVFFSDRCSKVVKSTIIPIGIATALKLVWGGREIRVISVYRPYESPPGALGSLRNAACKIVDNFEDSFWEGILAETDIKTLIGGDFNLEGAAVDDRIGASSFGRVPYPEQSSFRKLHLGNYNGASIDHVLANCGGVTSCVSSDGLYIGDHFPVVASLATGSPLIIRKPRLEVTPPVKLKSSDKGVFADWLGL